MLQRNSIFRGVLWRFMGLGLGLGLLLGMAYGVLVLLVRALIDGSGFASSLVGGLIFGLPFGALGGLSVGLALGVFVGIASGLLILRRLVLRKEAINSQFIPFFVIFVCATTALGLLVLNISYSVLDGFVILVAPFIVPPESNRSGYFEPFYVGIAWSIAIAAFGLIGNWVAEWVDVQGQSASEWLDTDRKIT